MTALRIHTRSLSPDGGVIGDVLQILGSGLVGWGAGGGGGASPLTTKGDVYGYSTTAARVPVGSNDQVLTADASTALGVAWKAPTPLTTKGDVLGWSTSLGRLGIGTNGQVLTADSTATFGFKWATPSGGGGGSSPLTTKGDVWGYSTADARLPVGANGYALFADSTTTLGVDWKPLPAAATDLTQLGIYNVKDFGAAGDDSIATTGAITSGTAILTVASATGLVAGRYVTVVGAGAATTTGTVSGGSTQMTVGSTTNLTRDTWITVAGAGAAGGTLYAKILHIIGSVVTLSEPAATGVTGNTVTTDGVLYDAKINSVVGTTVTLNKNAASTAAAGSEVKIDDYPAFVAAMNTMRVAIGGVGSRWYSGKLLVPPGVPNPTQAGLGQFFVRGYRMSRTLHIGECIQIEGVSGSADHPSCVLNWDKGTQGIVFDCPTNRGAQDFTHASGASLTRLALTSSIVTLVAPISGATIPEHWRPSTAYVAGEVRGISTKRDNNFGKAIKCLVGGTSRSGVANEPAWNSSGDNSGVYAEGGGSTVVWKMIDCDGLFSESNSIRLESLFIAFFNGNGQTFQASTPQAIGNIPRARDITIRSCGQGHHAHGNDANQGHFESVDVYATLGWGFWDDTLLGNQYYSCHNDGSLRGGYNIHAGNLINCYEEQGNGPIYITRDVQWIGGVPGDGWSGTIAGAPWSTGASIPAATTIVPTTPTAPPRFFKTFNGGTTGATEPNWSTALGRGDTVTDNGILWYCFGDPTVSDVATIQGTYMSPRTFVSNGGPTWGTGKAFFAATTNEDEYFGWSSEEDEGPTWHANPSWAWREGIGEIGCNGPDYNRTGTASFILAGPRAVSAGYADFTNQLKIPRKFRLGDHYTTEITIDQGTAAPVTGFFLKGSVRFNQNIAVGQPNGWRCTVAGTPGTWVAMANL